MTAYHMFGAGHCHLRSLTLAPSFEVGLITNLCPSEMRKLRFGEVKSFADSAMPRKWQSWKPIA